jgi:hypothetical protein
METVLDYLQKEMRDYSHLGVRKWDLRGCTLRKLLAAANLICTQAEVVRRSSSIDI